MATSTVTSTGVPSYEDYIAQQKLRNPSQNLGKNEFMQLLAAQLSSQDPLEPSKDTEFIAQLAQFSSLEQMQNLNSTMNAYQAYSLAGKYVNAEVTFEDGSTGVIPGIVDRIISKDGEMYAQIGDYTVKTSSITEVYDGNLFSQDNPLLTSTGLIGKNVRAKVELTEAELAIEETLASEEGREPVSYREVSGIVTRVSVVDGVMIAHIKNGEETITAPVANIYDIEDLSLSGDQQPPAAEEIPDLPATGEGETPPAEGSETAPVEETPPSGEESAAPEGGE